MVGAHDRSIVGLVAAMVIVAACNGCSSAGRACTAIATWSFRVQVEDSSNGARICDADVTASDGSMATRLTSLGEPDCTYAGVVEQLGTFKITTQKTGYRPSTTMITVDQSDGCHVVTNDMLVKLDPE
jgi:hypothetical protein